jgi:hypothetical protein
MLATAGIGNLFGYGALAVGSLVSGAVISTTGTDGATWILRVAIVAVAVATIWAYVRGHRAAEAGVGLRTLA